MSVSETTAEPPCNQNLQFLRPKKKNAFLCSAVSQATPQIQQRKQYHCAQRIISLEGPHHVLIMKGSL